MVQPVMCGAKTVTATSAAAKQPGHREGVAHDVLGPQAEQRECGQHPEGLPQIGARLTQVVDDDHPPGSTRRVFPAEMT
jgi:hypothetical protein